MVDYLASLNIVIFLSTFFAVLFLFLAYNMTKKKYLFFLSIFIYFFSLLMSISFQNFVVEFFSNNNKYIYYSFISIHYSLVFISLIWFSLYQNKKINNLLSVAMAYFGVKFFHVSYIFGVKLSLISNSLDVLKNNLGESFINNYNLSELISLEGIALDNFYEPFISFLSYFIDFILFFCFLLLIYNLIYKFNSFNKIPGFMKYLLITFISSSFFFLFSTFFMDYYSITLFLFLSIIILTILLNIYYSKKKLFIFKDLFGELNG